MAQHSHYWTCSKFADWVRGTPKPSAETSEGWNAWNKLAKKAHPYRFWLADEGLGNLQDFVTWPVRKLYDIKYYINNRWVSRTHSLTAHRDNIKPGQWQDVGHRFLPCMFNELVDFVEIETAWHHIAWGDDAERAKYDPPFWASGWFRWRVWRCPQAGIDHLNWGAGLKNDDEWVDKDDPNYGKPTYQAIAAMEILALYKWWTVDYKNRRDSMDISGWSEYCAKRRKKADEDDDGIMGFLSDGKETDQEKLKSREMLDAMHAIDADQDAEDEAMMIRLIKVRQSLWT